eukprot:330456-Chlamydomonas_euryale.AAC.1
MSAHGCMQTRPHHPPHLNRGTPTPPHHTFVCTCMHARCDPQGGKLSKAVEMCFAAKLFDVLQHIADDLEANASDPSLYTRCSEFFMQHGQFDKAVKMLIAAHQYTRALEMCIEQVWGGRCSRGGAKVQKGLFEVDAGFPRSRGLCPRPIEGPGWLPKTQGGLSKAQGGH